VWTCPSTGLWQFTFSNTKPGVHASTGPAFWKSDGTTDSDKAHECHAVAIEGYDTTGSSSGTPGVWTGPIMAVALSINEWKRVVEAFVGGEFEEAC